MGARPVLGRIFSNCTYKFANINKLKRYKDKKKTFCDHNCDKRFKLKDNLKAHIVGKIFKIVNVNAVTTHKTCAKSSKTVSKERVHQRMHNEERTKLCSKCDKNFKTVVEVRNHQYVHTEERPRQCDECKKSFKSSFSLKSHNKRVHGNIFSIVLNVIIKQNINSYLTCILTQNIRGYNFYCENSDCKYKTTSKASLKQHLESKHKHIKYPCSECDMIFV